MGLIDHRDCFHGGYLGSFFASLSGVFSSFFSSVLGEGYLLFGGMLSMCFLRGWV